MDVQRLMKAVERLVGVQDFSFHVVRSEIGSEVTLGSGGESGGGDGSGRSKQD